MYAYRCTRVLEACACAVREKSVLPSTIWTPGRELRFSGLVADVFSYRTILLALINIFIEYILNLYVSYSV